MPKLSRFTIPLIILTIVFFSNFSSCRKHHLKLNNDIRRFFKVSSFGYSLGGELFLDVRDFSFKTPSVSSLDTGDKNMRFGFTLLRSMSDSLTPYQEGREKICFEVDNDLETSSATGFGVVSLVMDMKKEEVTVKCTPQLHEISIFEEEPSLTERRAKRAVVSQNASSLDQQNRSPLLHDHLQSMAQANIENNHHDIVDKPDLREERRQEPVVPKGNVEENLEPQEKAKVVQPPLISKEDKTVVKPDTRDQNVENNANPDSEPDQPEAKNNQGNNLNDVPPAGSGSITLSQKPPSCRSLSKIKMKKTSDGKYFFSIKMLITRKQHEGLYSVFFHSCGNFEADPFDFKRLTKVNLTLDIMEKNLESYLSAGEIPLPELYFALSVIFFILGFIWLNVIQSKRQDCFPLHFLMALLVFVKALALLFHGINFHFISVDGSQVETWAILFYSTHVLKGALLLITIVLIGTGWAFVKQILSEKDKNLFMIVIPLQVFANIAEIVTQETEEGSVVHNKWREIFILVDMICCMAILFPVIWSIRHLQEAAHVDGKAAVNLKKLKLFRRFYVIVVSYIYFTRFIVYLLKMTVPFQYEWLDVFINHAAILVFFVVTGYHFQPTPRNPYFRVNQDDDLEMEEVLFEVTPNTYTESIHRVNQKNRGRTTVVEVDPSDKFGDNSDDDDRSKLISKNLRESSHDYD